MGYVGFCVVYHWLLAWSCFNFVIRMLLVWSVFYNYILLSSLQFMLYLWNRWLNMKLNLKKQGDLCVGVNPVIYNCFSGFWRIINVLWSKLSGSVLNYIITIKSDCGLELQFSRVMQSLVIVITIGCSNLFSRFSVLWEILDRLWRHGFSLWFRWDCFRDDTICSENGSRIIPFQCLQWLRGELYNLVSLYFASSVNVGQ